MVPGYARILKPSPGREEESCTRGDQKGGALTGLTKRAKAYEHGLKKKNLT